MRQKSVLVLSGLDPTGGAGLLTDIAAIRYAGVFSAGIPTALTVQSAKSVTRVLRIEARYLRESIAEVSKSFSFNGVKIGMVGFPSMVREIGRYLENCSIANIVLDTIFSSTSGEPLLTSRGLKEFTNLVGKATLITPNSSELEVLCQLYGVSGRKTADRARSIASATGTSVLVTGGHRRRKQGTDLLIEGDRIKEIEGDFFDERDYHGSGCAYSSLITAQLVKGESLYDAAVQAKAMLSQYMRKGFKSNEGRWFIGLPN